MQISSLKQQQKLSSCPPVTQSVNLSAYGETFTDEEIIELEKISPEVKSDSTFVRKIIFYLYNGCELHDVPTLRKRIKFEGAQTRMPDEARTVIKGMLSARLKAIEIPPFEYLARLNKYSVHISGALMQLVHEKTRQN